MNKLQSFPEIRSFTHIAEDFNLHLGRDDNQDIKKEFPATVERYGNGIDEAIKNFEATTKLIIAGEREQFIVMSGQKAVGLCMITNQIDSPPGIDQSWPNISGFIMNPFRGRGLGRFSMEERMKIVKQNFSDHAWTFVCDGNVHSEHLVLDVGFQKTGQKVEGWEDYHLYIYDGASI